MRTARRLIYTYATATRKSVRSFLDWNRNGVWMDGWWWQRGECDDIKHKKRIESCSLLCFGTCVGVLLRLAYRTWALVYSCYNNPNSIEWIVPDECVRHARSKESASCYCCCLLFGSSYDGHQIRTISTFLVLFCCSYLQLLCCAAQSFRHGRLWWRFIVGWKERHDYVVCVWVWCDESFFVRLY